MSIVVTGATGQLGRLVVESLLARGVAPAEVVATGRRTETLDDLAARGVQVRRADFDDPASVRDAFTGADKVLLVSATDVGTRVRQHRAAIDAAASAGASLIAYTSVAHADRSTLALGADHRATEQALADSGVPHVLLRNSWYLENYLPQIPTYLEHGVAGAAGDGRISAALRADYAAAAATVLAEDGHAGGVYELGGPGFTLAELAAAVAEASGREVAYTDLPLDRYRAVLEGAGLPPEVAATFADYDRAAAAGELEVDPATLERLLGRPPTTMPEAVRAAVAALPG